MCRKSEGPDQSRYDTPMPLALDITSPQNPRVKALVKLRDHKGRRAAGLFIAEGRRAVGRAVQAGLWIHEIWTCPALLGMPAEAAGAYVADLMAQGVPPSTPGPRIATVSESAFRKIAYVREPEGVLAVCQPPSIGLDTLPAVDHHTMDLVAIGTEKPGNLGAMVRTADAAGCRAVIAAGAPIDTMNPNAIRASTGAVFAVPTLALSEPSAIAHLRASGQRVIAAYPEQGEDHTAIDYTGPLAIAVGPEDRGLSPAWRDLALATGGAAVRIPMHGRVTDSLNASVATAVLLFEAARQRQT